MTAKKCTKKRDARAELLFCQSILNLLFFAVLVDVAVVFAQAPYWLIIEGLKDNICTTWPRFPFTCILLFISSTHKLVVSRNFVSMRIVLNVFICSFSILRKFQLEPDVCHLPYTWVPPGDFCSWTSVVVLGISSPSSTERFHMKSRRPCWCSKPILKGSWTLFFFSNKFAYRKSSFKPPSQISLSL